MKARYLWIVMILASTILFGFTFAPSAEAADQRGPRADYNLFFYADENVMYTALKAGTIDVMMWEGTTAQVYDAITDPELQMIPVPRFDMRAWSLHLNWTTSGIPAWGLVRNPLTDENFREGLAHAVDRDYYSEVVCGGFALPLPVPVPANSRAWWNETTATWVDNNLQFDVDEAKAAFTAGGFVDTDDNGVLNFPSDWEGAAGQNMIPIRLIRRADDTKRRDAMDHWIAKLTECEVPMEVISVASASEAAQYVMIWKNYHLYAAGWSMGRYPLALYSFYHSSRYIVGTQTTNYHFGPNANNTGPMYPVLDTLCDAFFYPVDLPTAKTAAMDCQDYIMRHKLFIPLWQSYSYYFYKNILGLTNEAGYGPEYTNSWFPINGYRADNPTAPIRVGIKNPPVSLNYVTANWVWEVSIFSRYMDGFMDLTPYNVLIDWPWLAKDWDVSTWVDPDYGTTKTLVKYWLREGFNWTDTVTGNDLGPRDATDHPFNCWYYDATTAAIPYTGYRDIKYLVVPNAYEIDVYFDSYSYWNWLNPFGRDIYPPAWRQEPISHLRTDTWIEGTNMTTGPGIQTLLNAVGNRSEGTPIEIVSIDVGGTPLTLDTTPHLATHTGDYCIAGTTAGGPKIRIFTDYAPGQVLTVTYWARGNYAGNTPGGLPWQDCLIGSGAHYISELNNVVGGWCTFKANRNFKFTTPPLGEIDFYWYYIEGPKPRGGYCIIDILDVVKCTAAYDSTGNGAPGGRYPSPNWEPGADLALEECIIDIFDVVTITGKYETVFWLEP